MKAMRPALFAFALAIPPLGALADEGSPNFWLLTRMQPRQADDGAAPDGCAGGCTNNLKQNGLGSLSGMGSVNQLATDGLAVRKDADGQARHRMFAIIDRTNLSVGFDSPQSGACKGACMNNLNPAADGTRAYGAGIYRPGTAQPGTQGRGALVVSTDRVGPAISATGAKIK
jgi:hypothetical protein